jgi:hypothetical protein
VPDHALDSILDACQLPVNEESDGTRSFFPIHPTIELLGSQMSQHFFLGGLRGSKYKQPINAIYL